MIIVHQAFTGAQYERPGMSIYERSYGWGIRSASWAQSRGGYWRGHLGWTDAAREARAGKQPLLLARAEPELGWAEAAIWDDDQPERIARRTDKRSGFARAHVLIWPSQAAADRYRHRVPHVDPATVGDGDLATPLEPIEIDETAVETALAELLATKEESRD